MFCVCVSVFWVWLFVWFCFDGYVSWFGGFLYCVVIVYYLLFMCDWYSVMFDEMFKGNINLVR